MNLKKKRSIDIDWNFGEEIYSLFDACQQLQEMLEAYERLQQGESLNIQMYQEDKLNIMINGGKKRIRNNLTDATMPSQMFNFFNTSTRRVQEFVHDCECQQHKLDEVSYHKLFDILKQYQKEVNELRAERMAKNANPLALVATAQTMQDPYYQTPKHHKSYAPISKASLPTRSHAATRCKGKEIAKPITPPSESASEEDSDPEQAQKDKDMQKNLALIAKYF
ncbi:hypothetical protein Tco_0573365 [Tanacetum coccineum]